MSTSSHDDYFLEKLATSILSGHPDTMHQVCVLLPNRRAGVFLKKHLAARLQSPAFAPAIYSIEDFVISHMGLNQADQLILLWELYVCYKEMAGDAAQSFEEFLKWGSVLLQDFEDVDMYLADAAALFNYLSEAKAIELWNPGKTSLSSGQTKYLNFYRSLKELYAAFAVHLEMNGLTRKGNAYRKLAENAETQLASLRWSHFIFAGFNALTPAEQKIIEILSGRYKVTHFFDADTYYLNDTRQEAGKYLREIRKQHKSGSFEWVGENLAKDQKKIQVIGVTHNTAQALVAGSILAGLPKAEATETAVVLNDESLLLPLLNAMPENIGPFNVTMGFPLRLTPVYGLMDTLFNLHQHAIEKNQKTANTENSAPAFRYYFRDVAGLLQHPFVLKFLSGKPGESEAVAKLLNLGKVFFGREEIVSCFGDAEVTAFLDLVFSNWQKVDRAIEMMISINEILSKTFEADSEDQFAGLNREYLYRFSLILNQLKLLVVKTGGQLSLRALHQLIKSVAASTQLPFTGEPLRGVQIMGMLETRTLDFRNVIMLSANEGVFPAGKNVNSFIPFDIRKEFGLPVYSDREAVFAYHFYRLLQRCESLYLIYNTTSDALGGGEKSRFILQLEHELIKANPNITFSESFYTPPVAFDQVAEEIVIEKTPPILERLHELARHGFSPSALSTFVSCSLKFYFTYILGMSEENTVSDSMDASTFGTGIHEALYELYKPFINKPLTTDILDVIAANAGQALHSNFLKAFNNNDIDFGRNFLMLKVAESFLRRFIRIEKDLVGATAKEKQHLIIIALEQLLGSNPPVAINITDNEGKPFPVRIRGKADRIDRIGSATRLIDFKTGSLKQKDLKINEWEDLLNDPDKSKALQLAVYGFLYANQFNTAFPHTGIISFRHLNDDFMALELPGESSGWLSETEIILRQLFETIFDPALPFAQTTHVKNCEYCPFSGICNK